MLPLLMVPVTLTALALLAALITGVGLAKRRVLLWVSSVLLLGFCAVGISSIGLFTSRQRSRLSFQPPRAHGACSSESGRPE